MLLSELEKELLEEMAAHLVRRDEALKRAITITRTTIASGRSLSGEPLALHLEDLIRARRQARPLWEAIVRLRSRGSRQVWRRRAASGTLFPLSRAEQVVARCRAGELSEAETLEALLMEIDALRQQLAWQEDPSNLGTSDG